MTNTEYRSFVLILSTEYFILPPSALLDFLDECRSADSFGITQQYEFAAMGLQKLRGHANLLHIGFGFPIVAVNDFVDPVFFNDFFIVILSNDKNIVYIFTGADYRHSIL